MPPQFGAQLFASWPVHGESGVNPMALHTLPSGKRRNNYGTSPFLMGKLTISMAIFNSHVSLPEGIYVMIPIDHWLRRFFILLNLL